MCDKWSIRLLNAMRSTPMDMTPELIISIIGTLSTAVVGTILFNLVKSQQSTINNMKTNMDSMKSFMDVFDVEKVKSFTKLSTEEAELRYKSLYQQKLQEVVNKSTIPVTKEQAVEAMERYIDNNIDFLESYEEIMSIPINIMLPMNPDQREQHLKHYPKNADLLRRFLQAIDRGEVEPDSSVLKKPPKTP
jgi:uncharacterized membrane-anchored protein YhcB (DUF1043 family)